MYFTDSRYTEEATAACGDLAEVVTVKSSNVFSTIAEYVRKFNIKTLGFEGKYVSFNTYSAMANAFDGVKLVPVDNALDEARMVKPVRNFRSSKSGGNQRQGFHENA